MSTITTSPQLLHTLTKLLLPPETRVPSPPPSPESLRRKELERIGKRIQLVTKETDHRVVKTYADLAEDDDDLEFNKAEKLISKASETIEDRAIGRYCDDDAWEQEMKQHGADGHISGFPCFSDRPSGGVKA